MPDPQRATWPRLISSPNAPVISPCAPDAPPRQLTTCARPCKNQSSPPIQNCTGPWTPAAKASPARWEAGRKTKKESPPPADTKLHRALDASGKGKPGKMAPAPVLPQAEMEPMPAPDSEEFLPAHSRLAPIATGSRQRAGNPLPLVEA